MSLSDCMERSIARLGLREYLYRYLGRGLLLRLLPLSSHSLGRRCFRLEKATSQLLVIFLRWIPVHSFLSLLAVPCCKFQVLLADLIQLSIPMHCFTLSRRVKRGLWLLQWVPMVLENVWVCHRAVRLYLLKLTTGIWLQGCLSSKKAHLFGKIVKQKNVRIGTFYDSHLSLEIPRLFSQDLMLDILIQDGQSAPLLAFIFHSFW